MQNNRLLFRKDVVEKHIRELERSVLPKIVRPRLIRYLLILLALLFAAGVWCGSALIPVHANGRAAVCLKCDLWFAAPANGPCIIALFPSENMPYLHAGQSMLLEIPGQRELLMATVAAVELGSPDLWENHRCLKWLASGAIPADRAAAAAIGRLPDTGRALPPWITEGALLARVEIGRRRLAGYLPWVGRFFDRPAKTKETRDPNGPPVL